MFSFVFAYHEVYDAFPISAIYVSIIKYFSVWYNCFINQFYPIETATEAVYKEIKFTQYLIA